MMRKHMNLRYFSIMSIGIFACSFLFINQAKGQEQLEESQRAVQGSSNSIRVAISTSGPVKFSTHWQENPFRLVVEFKSMNVTGKIDNEVAVNQGVLKRITSRYQNESLQALTFELTQKVPYEIRQENNTILLDLQAPIETEFLEEQAPLTTLVFGMSGKEISTIDETGQETIERVEAMDTALTKLKGYPSQLKEEKPVSEPPLPLAVPKIGVVEETKEGIEEAGMGIIVSKSEVIPKLESPVVSKGIAMGLIFWPAGLILISGFGLLGWRRYRLLEVKQINKLRQELQENKDRLGQEEAIRKTVEQTSLKKENEYQKIKSELQRKEFSAKTLQEESLRKAKEHEELEHSFESLKNVLEKKGLVKELSSPEEEGKLWISGESTDKRQSSRLGLTQDYNRTIIIRIESQNNPEKIKSLAKNISTDGLCFASKREFKEGELINLRLFFYGDQVPIIKAQALIVWKKEVGETNYYGVLFDLLDEKDKLELNHYIESKSEQVTTGA